MRTTLTLAIAVYAGTLYAQQPYNYSTPMRMAWGYQAWALTNESEFVRKLPDQNDFTHEVGRLAAIRNTLRQADYYEEQTRLLREQREALEDERRQLERKKYGYYGRLYKNPYFPDR